MARKDKQIVIATYNVPYFGRIQLLDDSKSPSTEQPNGAYWARVEKIGAIGRYSETEDELKQRVSDELKLLLLKESKDLISKLAEINDLLPNRAAELSSLDNWLEQYTVMS